MSYQFLKSIHVGFAMLSIAGFILRYAMMLVDSPMLGRRLIRVLPHIIDTVLLVSAIWLAFVMGAVPGRDAWLTVKIVALLAYIVLGAVALRRGRTKLVRVVAGVLAVAVFSFIVSVAMTKSPMGFLG